MSIRTPKIFFASNPESPNPQFCSGNANAKKIKTLWQSARFFTLFLSVGGGFPLWNVGLKRRRCSWGQFTLTVWTLFILSVYGWTSFDVIAAVYRNAHKIRWSAVSLNVNVALGCVLVFRTIFTTLLNWWHQADLNRIFNSLDTLQSKVAEELGSIWRVGGLLLYVILAGVALGGPRIVLYMVEDGFYRALPMIFALTMMDLIGGRSPILLFIIFAEAFIGIAHSIRLRFEALVKHSDRWVCGKQDIQKVEDLRRLHGKLCSVIEDWSACYSTALVIGLLVDMTCIISILYATFMDLIPACKCAKFYVYCTAIPMAITYCLSTMSFVILLCAQGERLYRNVSCATRILNLIPYPHDEVLKLAVSAFSSQVMTSDSAASLHRCFDIRLSLLPTIIGTAFTYLIIIIQFRQADTSATRD